MGIKPYGNGSITIIRVIFSYDNSPDWYRCTRFIVIFRHTC